MPIDPFLAVAAMLFALGAVGFLTRRNLILVFLSAEMMLHGVSLTLTTFSQMHQNAGGQVFTIMILTVAACEAGIALPLVLSLYQRRRTLDLDLWSDLREADLPSPIDPDSSAPTTPDPGYENLPKLAPAGRPLDLRTDRTEAATHV